MHLGSLSSDSAAAAPVGHFANSNGGRHDEHAIGGRHFPPFAVPILPNGRRSDFVATAAKCALSGFFSQSQAGAKRAIGAMKMERIRKMSRIET
ncbi:hypothetical protein J3E64_001942 [Sphingobium sp. OAS761]|uniref:hypothetical protein n=1 Tax=Sphingobium sp. OAS761 TaxID=2817901 RepID=UPI00209DD052|nr:hypothetical protein [Sphingobium sp. OAS761]MCP1470254.1 hypothetical protein [Sphingobium sp. OAS761]